MPGEDPSEIIEVARDAYICGVPMVDTWKTMYAFDIAKGNPQYKGPFNSVLNIARVFTPDDTAFGTPNSDTPYTFAGLSGNRCPTSSTLSRVDQAAFSWGRAEFAGVFQRACFLAAVCHAATPK